MKKAAHKLLLFWRWGYQVGYDFSIQFRRHEVVFRFHPRSTAVWVAVEVIAAIYIASFAWFWQLCRSSARRELTHFREEERPSNLIPFERGVQLHLRKHPTAI